MNLTLRRRCRLWLTGSRQSDLDRVVEGVGKGQLKGVLVTRQLDLAVARAADNELTD